METTQIELSQEERELLIEILRKTPVQGTIDTLPRALALLVGLLKKLEEAK